MIGSVFSFARSWRIGAALLIGAAGVLVPVTQAAGADGPLVVSLTFNDGRMTQYSYARPVLRAHNVFGTFYVSSKVIEANAPGYMATWHVDALYRDGDEIGGLTKDHVDLTAQHDPDPAADLAWKQDQVCGDKQRLAQLGYDPQSFSYPFAAVNAAAESIVQGCGYLSGRTVGGLSTTTGPYALTNPPADPYWLSTANLPTGPIQLSTLQNAVTAAVSHGGGWLPVAFDQVCDSADPNYSSCMGSYKPIDATVLSDFLDWLQNGAPAGVSVARVRDVMGAPPQPPLPPRPTVVSLTFDDGDKTQYGVRPILNDAHVHGTFYVNTGAVDSGDEASMTWTQIHNLANDGNDVGGHTRDHMDLTSTSTSYDYKWHQACDDRARLQEQGLWPASFAYPFAAFNATAAEIVRGCGYQSGRTGGSILVGGPLYSEKIPPPDAYTIKTLGTLYNGAITLQWLQDAVNGAADRAGGWVPMVFHEICYTADPDFGTCMNGYRPVSDTTLTQFIDWVAQQANRGVSIKSVTEVMSGGQTLPSVRITAPPAGGSTAQSPVIGGTASGTGDVTVALYAGPYSVGTPVATVVAPVTSGTWSARIPGPLAQGTYTAQANQTAGALTGYSSPQTFAVVADITAPAVQITAPRSGERTNKTTPVISGTAGTAADDNPAVTVDIYSGSTPGGTPLQTLNATADGTGAWSVQTAQALTEGTYTAVATQSDIYANTGTSTPVVFTVDLTVPVVQITAPADGSRTNVKIGRAHV